MDALSDLQDRFAEFYGRTASKAERAVEREVFGVNAGINGYTTVAQAGAMADAVAVGPGMRLLDVGAGTGWPGLYIGAKTGCEVVLTEVQRSAMSAAAAGATKQGLAGMCAFAAASGKHLPFQPRSFGAIVHTDVL